MILAINSSTTQFGIALMKEDGVVSAEYLISPKDRNFMEFVPALHSLLASAGNTPKDLTAVVTATGPGSFTGLRVGLAAAKGLVHGLGIPLIGVSSLEAMANQIHHISYPLCAMISSRKGEVFTAFFKWSDDQGMMRSGEDRSHKLNDLDSIIDVPTLFLGNDFNSQGIYIKELLGNKAILAPHYLWVMRPSVVGAMGLRRFKNKDFDDIRDLVPVYLRPPDIRANPYHL
jgi:tRNA threonylcarbamoyladenosine biosynthesis protein TsaB